MSTNDPSAQPIRVLAIDDHPMLREGIASALADQPDMQLVAEAANARAGIEQYRLTRPDVTLMDLQMPDLSGIDAIRIIRSEFPEARIIVLTTYQGDVHISGALRAGAWGFLLKDTLRKGLREAIRSVHAGRRVIPADVAIVLAEHVTDELLSLRELDVLRGAARGNANKRIAAELGISEDTVKAHMKNILAKLGANDRTHAVVTAVKRGIIEI
jgi:two-component system NarL family response regulator